MKLPTSMCSGPIACEPPSRRSTPVTCSTFEPMPSILRAERDEETAEVLHVRLARGVRDHRLARRERRRHDRVLRRHDATPRRGGCARRGASPAQLVAAVRSRASRRARRTRGCAGRVGGGRSRRRRAAARLARPRRASSGPASRNDARMRLASTWSTSCDRSRARARAPRSAPVHSASAPRCREQPEHRLDVADPRHVRQLDRLVRRAGTRRGSAARRSCCRTRARGRRADGRPRSRTTRTRV